MGWFGFRVVHGVGLARLLLGGDLDRTLLPLEKLESLSKLPERLRRLGGDLESFLAAGSGLRETRRRGGERDRDRDGEGDRRRGGGGARFRAAPGGGETDLILVSTGVRDRARRSGRRGGGDRESEYRRRRGGGELEYRLCRGGGVGERDLRSRRAGAR
jgi:hypothetical protein